MSKSLMKILNMLAPTSKIHLILFTIQFIKMNNINIKTIQRQNEIRSLNNPKNMRKDIQSSCLNKAFNCSTASSEKTNKYPIKT